MTCVCCSGDLTARLLLLCYFSTNYCCTTRPSVHPRPDSDPDCQTPRPPDPDSDSDADADADSDPSVGPPLRTGWLAADYAALASGGCFPQARSCKSWSWWRLLEATGGSLVQLGPIVRPLPFPRPRAASYSYISSFLLLHPPSHCTAPHRTALLENPPTQDKRLLFELLSHLGFWACGLEGFSCAPRPTTCANTD